jgi:glycosyltransferase involved in cell wall biosynthesis
MVLLSAYRLSKRAKEFDVLFPNSQKAAVISMLANLVSRKPVIWYLHDILSAEHFNKIQRFFVVALANLTALYVLTNSKASAAAFVGCGGKKALVSIVPCGIDPSPFDAVSDAEAYSARSGLNLNSIPIVGLFGRISPWKGQHILIKALKELTGVHAIIVGGVLFGEQNYKDELIELAKSLDVAERVHWLGFRDDIPTLMRAVDIVLHTSVAAEPFGRVIVEGMLARRPVIAAADGASREILGDEYRFLVKPGDPSALAKAIASMLVSEQGVKDELVEKSYARAFSMFSMQQMIEKIDQALAGLK